MRCILKQLSCSKSDLPVRAPVSKRYKQLKEEADGDGHEEPPKLTVTESVELILALLERNPATIIIDALDECDPVRRHELLGAFDTIIRDSANVVKIFVSRGMTMIFFAAWRTRQIYASVLVIMGKTSAISFAPKSINLSWTRGCLVEKSQQSLGSG
jgi:hypothetical protein